jgi:predicted metal-dependent HD superfamily phosphohydrolase
VVTVFALMDAWIAAAGRTDPWLSLGLDLMDGWQADPVAGQKHLAAVLSSLGSLRPAGAVAPDPVALAVWFHHSRGDGVGRTDLDASAAAAYEALSGLTEPALAHEVARLVRVLGAGHPEPGDLAGKLLHAAHRAAMGPSHLA